MELQFDNKIEILDQDPVFGMSISGYVYELFRKPDRQYPDPDQPKYPDPHHWSLPLVSPASPPGDPPVFMAHFKAASFSNDNGMYNED